MLEELAPSRTGSGKSNSRNAIFTRRSFSTSLPKWWPQRYEAVNAAMDQRDATLLAKQKEVETLFAGSPSGLELREQETYWYAISTEGAATRQQLLDWANAAQSAVQQLSALQPLWHATLQEIDSTSNHGAAFDVIRDSVKSIQASQAQAQDLLQLIVNLQVTAASQHQMALDTLDKLAKAREQMKGRVLQRDSLPLWQIFTRRRQEEREGGQEQGYHARTAAAGSGSGGAFSPR